jgi:adenylate cyclase
MTGQAGACSLLVLRLPSLCRPVSVAGQVSPDGARVTALDVFPNHHALIREVRAVLLVDVVDSVRQMRLDEERLVGHWLELQDAIVANVIPRHSGHLVKSTGDGLLLDFASIRDAVGAAFAIQLVSRRLNEAKPAGERLHLRMGIETGSLIVGEHDIYGNIVNRAARLVSSLARPDEIVMSATARDQLTPALDADIEDLGECYLKGIDEPVRAYRARPPGALPRAPIHLPVGPVLPAIAVIPFTARLSAPEHYVLGEIIADGMIRKLSRSQTLDVISRLSTSAFRDRAMSIAQIGQHLKCNYVLSGTYGANASSVVLDIELAEVRSERIVWSERYSDKLAGVVANETALIDQAISDVYNAMAENEVRRARTSPLTSLESYALMLSALTLMHRRSARDFVLAREMLETVIEREPRQALPRAWLAHWHVLRIQQGLTGKGRRDRAEAESCTRAALDLEPDNSMALAIDGLVHTHITRRHDLALASYEQATRVNPNDALAWLLKGTHHAFTGDGPSAVHDTQKALRLSPLDPQGYYYHSLAATAFITANDPVSALSEASVSLTANCLHTSTLRVKAVAEWRLGLQDVARNTTRQLLGLEPDFTVSEWLKRSPSAMYQNGRDFASSLRAIGVPP